MSMLIDYKLLGNRIKNVRKNVGLSQESLAEMIDVSSVYLSRIERGTTKVSLERLAHICNALNCNIGFILTGAEYNSESYQHQEILCLLQNCQPDTIKLITKIIEPIVNYRTK